MTCTESMKLNKNGAGAMTAVGGGSLQGGFLHLEGKPSYNYLYHLKIYYAIYYIL